MTLAIIEKSHRIGQEGLVRADPPLGLPLGKGTGESRIETETGT